MKYSIVTLGLLATSTIAAPVQLARRADYTDADILNYALTLEHLEATFYAEALSNYTESDFIAAGFSSMFYQNLQEIAYDEATHVTFLTTALQAAGATPVAACTYSFGVTTPTEFVALASVLEGVGVAAYLGAAQDIASKAYLTAAGSILTVEARHNAYIRFSQMPPQSPFPAPFDSPLDLDQVYTLAGSFITTCPASNPTLPVKAFPGLSVATDTVQPVREGQLITFNSATAITGTVYAAFITVTGPVYAPVTSMDGGMSFVVTIPHGPTGQSYVVLNNCNTGVSDTTILAGPAVVNVEAYYFYESPSGTK